MWKLAVVFSLPWQIFAGPSGPASWTAGDDSVIQTDYWPRICTEHKHCWANKFVTEWPGSNVIKLTCAAPGVVDSHCICKFDWMDADNDRESGCEFNYDEATCPYGSCTEHGIVMANDGDWCGNWNGYLQCNTGTGCCERATPPTTTPAPTTTTPTTTTPTTTPVDIVAEQINILAQDTLTLSFATGIEVTVIEPEDMGSRFFVGYDYDEAADKCGKLGGHLPIIGNDNDKMVLWTFMQMIKPGQESYWLHFHTAKLGELPFVDQKGDDTKWTVELSGFAREGKEACTMWHYRNDYGSQYIEQTNCKVLEADCRFHQAYTTICMKIPNAYVLPEVPCPERTDLHDGTCWSGNWTLFFNDDDGSDGNQDENLEHYQSSGDVQCPEISAIDVQIVGQPEFEQTTQDVDLDQFTGFTCEDSDNGAGCYDYEIRFCCEGCCPKLNVSGDPELTDYYEDYPGIYQLQYNLSFNGLPYYRQISGYDDVGEIIYGMGYVYYWEDVGWLLGANLFTYSYYSDGIGDKCPQYAPWNWTNEVFGTQILVECLPIYPSCNDVECNQNSYCLMLENGPTCVCHEGYEQYEDGACLAPTTDPIVTDPDPADCSVFGAAWSDWLNSDTPDNYGDWETLSNFARTDVCESPISIEAQRTDASVTPLIVHVDMDLGFWCINAEQEDGITCADFEVRFCCKKWMTDECAKEGYDWTYWINGDTPSVSGDWETVASYSDGDVCDKPIAVEAQLAVGSSGSSAVTHIAAEEGFWCINEEQGDNGDCADFEARFCCPTPVKDEYNITYVMDGTCDDTSFDWTPWMNSGGLDDDGDWETLGRFTRHEVCANPTGIQARSTGVGGADYLHIHKDAGFWCLNDENSEDCADFEVRFCCELYRTGDCIDENHQWTGWYNDEWGKKNERLWVSSKVEEELLQWYGDGGACRYPTQSEIRVRPTGSTSFQNTIWEYSKNLIHHLKPDGYTCINEEQTGGYRCVDMEIRFCCPNKYTAGTCDVDGYDWTDWWNTDAATGDGDWEARTSLMMGRTCNDPIAIEAQPLDSGSTQTTHIDIDIGFYCINEEQSNNELCAEFEVRYCCPKTQIGSCNQKGWEWTPWLDRDDPDGVGDLELLHAFEPNEVCMYPMGVKMTDLNAGERVGSLAVTHIDYNGFTCYNDEQPSGNGCTDFAVSFCCPVDEDLTCEDIECSANEWCLETGEGPICKCGDDDFNDDPDGADFVEYEDGACISVESPVVTANGTYTYTVGTCSEYGYTWTDFANNDDAGDLGDFEFLTSMNKKQGCQYPIAIRATTNDTNESWPVHMDLERGFWCVNSEMSNGAGCNDWSVQLCCPKEATGDCSEDGFKWTPWYNNDNADGMGDWEPRIDTMCETPIAIKAEVVTGDFDAITHIDNIKGFYCLNEENAGGCSDYQVSFCCPDVSEGDCDSYGQAWGEWLDKDDPPGLGDLELITSFSEHAVCSAPTGVKVQTISGDEPNDAFRRISIVEGFVCQNDIMNMCDDFEVSFCCPKWGAGDLHCNTKGYEWTDWIDQDDPSTMNGDWETRESFGERRVCTSPIGVQAYPLDDGSTAITHIDETIGFWCVNQEQNGTDVCADFAVRFCCPQYEHGTCDEEGYEWTDWLDRDDPTGDGDFENRPSFSSDEACSDPIAVNARARSSGSTAITHLDLYHGFWCLNEEQPDEDCADHEIRFCCPKKNDLTTCDKTGYEWTVWLDRDDPTDSGDWENRFGFQWIGSVVCNEPLALEAQVVSGSFGSSAVTHYDTNHGFWCINDEQPKDQPCADFEVRFCCPDVYYDPCIAENITCIDDAHITYMTHWDAAENDTVWECTCACNEGYLAVDGNINVNGTCEQDLDCVATIDSCVDFDKCINTNNWLDVKSDANCNVTVCADCSGAGCLANPNENGAGLKIGCSDTNNHFPANNGGLNGYVACVCDGKVNCEWTSDDFLGDVTEDDICISDHNCPISAWMDYEGELDITRNAFINDPAHNTLQADLYDSSKAEVLGRIQTTAIRKARQFTDWNWDEGHYLVAVWEDYLKDHVIVTPYGDYYSPMTSDHGDGDVYVWETFVNNLVLADGSPRDTASQNLNVVLDISHDYELDIEDITELLDFRVAMVPKTWVDQYGDTIKKTAGEVSECLNAVLDNQGKLAIQARWWKRQQKRGPKQSWRSKATRNN